MLSALLLAVWAAPATQLPEPAAAAELTREQALAILHEGFADREDRARLLADPPSDPAVRVLLLAGALVPARSSHLPPLAGAERERVLDLVLEGVLGHHEEREPELLFERLRGALGDRELRALAAECAAAGDDPAGRRRAETALEVLLGGPTSLAAPIWGELALDSGLPQDARVELLDRWILAVGRPALDCALDSLLEGGPPALQRRLLGLWLPMMTPADLPRLRAVTRDSNSTVADTAFQLWARQETDPAQRLEILRETLERPAHLRQVALRALAANGQEPALAEELVDLLDGPVADHHELAERVLPAFLAPERLFQVYLERLPAPERSASRAAAMVTIARIPVPEARRLAAGWLSAGGWADPVFGSAVARELGDCTEVDDVLPRLLETEEVPPEVARPLALARAATSETARSYLRRMLADPEQILQEQAIRALVGAGDPYDLPLLQEVVLQPGYASGARAAALGGLARPPGGRAWMLQLLEQEPPDYEVRAALVSGLIEHGDAGQRAAALDHARRAPGFDDPDLALGLALMAWQIQRGEPRPEEAGALCGELVEAIAAVRPRFEDGLPDPRRAAAAFPRVHGCARALARCMEAGGVLPRIDPEPLHPPALLHAAAILVREAPAAVQEWCRDLAQREQLDPSLRLRALATATQAGLLLGPQVAVPTLELLLRHPQALRDYPWDLAFGLGAEDARTWILPGDRLREELRLARAALVSGAERLELLLPLLEGYASPSNLVDAGWLALADREGRAGGGAAAEAAVALARRAVDWAPRDPRPRELLARAWAAAGQVDLAEAAAADGERLEDKQR